jgi:hypothetical protein
MATPTHKHYETAKRAHYWTSFSPDKRALSECAFYDEIQAEFSESPEILARFEKLFLADLAAKSRCASPMITGPARFPVARNEKAMASARNHADALFTFLDKVRARRDKPEPTAIASNDPDALDKLREKLAGLERAQETMKQANKIIRAKPLDMPALIALLGSEAAAQEITAPGHFGGPGFASFSLSNNNANIKTVRDRIATLEKLKDRENAVHEYEGLRVVENVEAVRLQLFFDEKPDDTMRASLKRHGFRWAPSVGAWQRQLTNNALYSFRQLKLSKKGA